MTQLLSTQEAGYLAAFASFEKNGAAQDPSWVHALRQAAITRFRDLGFPVARRGNEEWKYTDVGPIARAPFQPLLSSGAGELTAAEVEPFAFGGSRWPRLVFVDGNYAAKLSSASFLPSGATAGSLAEAMRGKADLVEPSLARHARYADHAFTALNTAFLHDGAFVHIPDGVAVAEPIHLLFLSTASAKEGPVSHPRVLVLTGRGSHVTLVEDYVGLRDSRYFTNAVTEAEVGPGATVRHYRLQRQSEEAYHIGTTQIVLGRDSAFSSVTVDLGGGLVRNNLNVLLGEEGGSCTVNGVYLVAHSQHVDNQVVLDHAKPHTTSRELYKGVLGGRSRSVFHGSIIVRKGAQKVDARQVDKNLLLSDGAEADSKPAFWIYADDVKCSHGAACGKLDEDALFYLRSRGLAEEEARNLLVHGFVSEVLNTIEDQAVRTRVEELVAARLQQL
jgi:Fe-S cluster assembly protein SufD